MQPHIANGTSNGHVVIDIVKDANTNEWPPIVLDINNITVSKAEGNFKSKTNINMVMIIASICFYVSKMHA